jgi:hypothetical protein
MLREFQERYPEITLNRLPDAAARPAKEGLTLADLPPASEELVRAVSSGAALFARRDRGATARPAPAPLSGTGWGCTLYLTRDRWVFTSWRRIRRVGTEGGYEQQRAPLRRLRLRARGIVCVPTLVATDAILSGKSSGARDFALAHSICRRSISHAAHDLQAAVHRDARGFWRAAM